MKSLPPRTNLLPDDRLGQGWKQLRCEVRQFDHNHSVGLRCLFCVILPCARWREWQVSFLNCRNHSCCFRYSSALDQLELLQVLYYSLSLSNLRSRKGALVALWGGKKRFKGLVTVQRLVCGPRCKSQSSYLSTLYKYPTLSPACILTVPVFQAQLRHGESVGFNKKKNTCRAEQKECASALCERGSLMFYTAILDFSCNKSNCVCVACFGR